MAPANGGATTRRSASSSRLLFVASVLLIQGAVGYRNGAPFHDDGEFLYCKHPEDNPTDADWVSLDDQAIVNSFKAPSELIRATILGSPQGSCEAEALKPCLIYNPASPGIAVHEAPSSPDICYRKNPRTFAVLLPLSISCDDHDPYEKQLGFYVDDKDQTPRTNCGEKGNLPCTPTFLAEGANVYGKDVSDSTCTS